MAPLTCALSDRVTPACVTQQPASQTVSQLIHIGACSCEPRVLRQERVHALQQGSHQGISKTVVLKQRFLLLAVQRAVTGGTLTMGISTHASHSGRSETCDHIETMPKITCGLSSPSCTEAAAQTGPAPCHQNSKASCMHNGHVGHITKQTCTAVRQALIQLVSIP